MYTALQISSFFIKKGVSPLKLQKLLFYAQVWYFAKEKKKLFSDDIQAWVLGPVIEPVWQAFRHMRRGDYINENKADVSVNLPSDIQNHLSDVWRAYGNYTGIELVDITHDEFLWLNARQGLPDHATSRNIIKIDDSLLPDFQLDRLGHIPTAGRDVSGFGHINGFVDEKIF